MEIIIIDGQEYEVDIKRKLVTKKGTISENIKFMELCSMYDRGIVQMSNKDIQKVFLAYYNN